MSNIPMIPMTWNLDNTTMIIHNGTRFAIHTDGSMIIEGKVKDAALGLVKYVVQREYVRGVTSWVLNNSLLIDFDETGWTIGCLAPDGEPPFFAELAREFDRIIKMKVFW
jgi:hypothetical protein